MVRSFSDNKAEMISTRRIRHIFSIALTVTLLASCSEYQMVLKSRDSDLWYRKGLEYYEKGDYVRASNLLAGVINSYGGSMRADTISRTYAKSLMEIGDYYMAAQYFQTYVKTFPSSEHCEECQYLSGYCYYKLSPKVELDQADTKSAIDEFQTYLNEYSDTERVPEITAMMKEMQDKLAYKDYLSAKLYFNLGNYMGNNYKSAVITAQNCLRKYPDTKYREELSYLILESKYIQAERSVVTRQSERYRDAIDEYYSFINEYPQSRYAKSAVKILESSQKGLKHAEKIAPPSQDDLDYYRNFGTRLDAENDAKLNNDEQN